MKISVVLTTYNGEKFLNHLLESVYSQSIAIDEVLIFDDCSTDSTVYLIKNFISNKKLNDKWRVVVNEENKGYEKNFFDAISKAIGDIIFFCDQDDVWKKNKVEICRDLFLEKADINLLCTNNDFLIQNTDKTRKNPCIVSKMSQQGEINHIQFSQKNFKLGRPGCDMAVRRIFFSEISKYWIAGWAQDEFVWKFGFVTDSIYIINIIGITRRIHDENTAHKEGVNKYRNRKGRVKHLESNINEFNSLIKFCRINKIEERRVKIIEKNIEYLRLRIKFIETRNPIVFLILFVKYFRFYSRKMGFVLDFMVTYLGESICKKF